MRTILFTAMLAAAPLSAQDANLTVPAAWKVRADRGTVNVVADEERSDPRTMARIVTMAPGWHVTTGPALIAYDPSWQAGGTYRAEAEIFLFPGERAEGYGMFVGGANLEGADQTYLYVLLRKDGRYLVKRRVGAGTETLVDWTAHEAVVPHTGQDGTAKNVLAVNVRADDIQIVVNGQVVTTVPRAGIPTDGQVGLRVNHALNLHVSRVEIVAGG